MKILIIKSTNIKEVVLSKEKIGSFILSDVFDRKEEQLTIIEGINDKWIMKSTDDTNIIVNNLRVDNVELQYFNYYTIEKDGNKILLYVDKAYDDTFTMHSIDQDTITIGNAPSDTISYGLSFITPNFITLKYMDNKWQLLKSKPENAVFVNKEAISGNGTILNNGDEIFIYGFKIVVLANYIMINNPNGLVIVNNINFIERRVEDNGSIDTSPIKEVSQYGDDDYFMRSPRIRRKIETYEVKIDSPPSPDSSQEQSILLTMGPMLIMGSISLINFFTVLTDVMNKQTTLAKSIPRLLICGMMLVSTFIWPFISRKIRKRQRVKKEKEKKVKYRKYLEEKKLEIQNEIKRQTDILKENLISCEECYQIINNKRRVLWERKIGQQDFLTFKVGRGSIPADIKFSAPEKRFSMVDDDLKDDALKLVNSMEILNDVPISYSLLDNNISAIMGLREKVYPFVENMILQLVAFHGYDELKIVVFTNEKNSSKWKYIKELPHCWNDTKEVRYYSETKEERLELSEMLNKEMFYRRFKETDTGAEELKLDYNSFANYYLIITDNIDEVRNLEFVENVLNQQINIGYSFVVLDNKISRLPSQCTNFINLGPTTSTISKIDLDVNDTSVFSDEIVYGINMHECAKTLSNIPIEVKKDASQLTTSLGFLEMFGVGNVNQLNIHSRWKNSDSTKSLRADVGVNENGEKIFLDLHEKYHGPHGLIAGMTGSGKSEFIITYILSMAINYSPDEVQFILIDYKGGGLAGAFKNIKKDLVLPHLAGVITNLDKSEINRTLVSINSELKRRQEVFNKVRDELGESTIDIYKYQKLYKEGKIADPVPHLLIVCDEFAELKNQQPEFMDDLISAARIGRSLGVHLILATQKPTGVVNAQIWSNSKFKVCLKVQDKGDSTEMIRVPDAAALKNAGRFYLQVGFNELFVLGQSAWCGTPYNPKETIKKKTDKSISFINNLGFVIKTISSEIKPEKKENYGEELVNVLQSIVEEGRNENKTARQLWLESIPEFIFEDKLEQKYNFSRSPYKVTSIIGELDNPAYQSQELLSLKLYEEGNTIIYSSYSNDEENLIVEMVYSICKNYTTDEVNIYIADFGSEMLRCLDLFPQVGDMCFQGDTEKINNLFKKLHNLIEERKKIFADFGGDYNIFIKNAEKKLPLEVVIINNYDSYIENYSEFEEDLLQLSREGQRYGLVFIITCNSPGIIKRRIKQNFTNHICLRFVNEDDYSNILGNMKGKCLADYSGRGFIQKDSILEFQTALICDDDDTLGKIKNTVKQILSIYDRKAPKIPVLPDKVVLDDISKEYNGLSSIPIGIEKKTLSINNINLIKNNSAIFLSNDINNGTELISIILKQINNITDTTNVLFDSDRLINGTSLNNINIINENFEEKVNKIIEILNSEANKVVVTIVNFDKFVSNIEKTTISNLIKILSTSDKLKLIILDTDKKLKKYEYESFYKPLFESSVNYWIGNGVSGQTVYRTTLLSKELKVELDNSFAWQLTGSDAILIKLVSNNSEVGDSNEG